MITVTAGHEIKIFWNKDDLKKTNILDYVTRRLIYGTRSLQHNCISK